MFEEYKTKVLLSYRQKLAQGMLAPNLERPTPAKLKEECIVVLSTRYNRQDEKAIRSFFGNQDDIAGYMQVIRSYDVDKFRPLVNFLKGNTNTTEDKNVELLAWLINYEPRPYRFDYPSAFQQAYDLQKDESAQTKESKAGTTVDELPEVASVDDFKARLDKEQANTAIRPEPVKGGLRNKLILLLGVLIILGAGTFLFLRNKANKKSSHIVKITGPEKCMYWTGDQYELISCNQQLEDTLIIAADTEKLIHFKKITEPDTLTESSVGKVGYFKINGSYEFYTTTGIHPDHPERRLKPLTVYVLNKYLSGKH